MQITMVGEGVRRDGRREEKRRPRKKLERGKKVA